MSRARTIVSLVLPPLATVLIVILAWEGAVSFFSVPGYLLPPPSRVAAALWSDRVDLLWSTARTAGATAAGFAIAATLGVTIGSTLSFSLLLERGIYPLTLLFQMVPLVAIAPLLVIWLGNGPNTVIAASAVVAIFPVIANTVGGLRSTDPLLEELFAISGATRWQRWTRLGLPSAVPSIVTGLRIAAGLATIGAIVGEFVAGFGGDVAPLGIVITASLREFRTEKVFAAVALASLVGFALFGVVSALSTLLLRRYDASP
ncbi:MAG: ABC transporter permease [Phycisphaerae bacterium]|nr:ABC transporter permease [Phycisphaerae bacterium]